MSVSVIMTCHNEERFVAQAVESVLEQTALPRIGEIIVVDDGSTDGSAAVIAAIARNDPRIIVMTADGVGPAAARNLAIQRAAGDYVAFLDCDDFWAADKLERQLAVFDAGCQAGLLYSDFIDFSAPDFSDALYVRVRRYQADQEKTLKSFFLHGGPIITSTILLRSALLSDVGLFDESYHVYEDAEFYLRVAERWTFQHVTGAVTYKRRHGGNITRRLDALLPTLEGITQEWAARRPELEPLAHTRASRCYAKAGNDCIAHGERRRGAALLMRALCNDPRSWRIYLYLLLAAIPARWGWRVRRMAKVLLYRNRYRKRLGRVA